MANLYFGEIGDVWKHLLLMEVLGIERPRRYWESHAGSARYPLRPSAGRRFGVYRFLDAVGSNATLAASAYRTLLAQLPQDDEYPTVYPGSAVLSMMLLGDQTTFVLCDLDVDSVRGLNDEATRLGIGAHVEAKSTDGLDQLLESSRAVDREAAHETLAFIDPYEAQERSPIHAVTSVELALQLARAGCMVVFWFGYDEVGEEGWAPRALAEYRADPERPTWYGEVGPPRPEAAPLLEDGMRGCGLVCLNCSMGATEAARRVGRSLVAAYQNVAPEHPGAQPGLRYTESHLAWNTRS